MLPLRKEIGAALVIKVVLLTILWWLFFSNPTSHHLDLPSYKQHFLMPEQQGGLP